VLHFVCQFVHLVSCHGCSVANARTFGHILTERLRSFATPFARSLHAAIVDERDRSNVRSLHAATNHPPMGDVWGNCKGNVNGPQS
jgi:hypothetical protein